MCEISKGRSKAGARVIRIERIEPGDNASMYRKLSFAARWGFALLLAIACAHPGWAQFTSSVDGTVHDATGAAIPKATVQLINVATHDAYYNEQIGRAHV